MFYTYRGNLQLVYATLNANPTIFNHVNNTSLVKEPDEHDRQANPNWDEHDNEAKIAPLIK